MPPAPAARAHAETTVGIPSGNVKAPKLFGARASPYEGPLAPAEHRGLCSGAVTTRSNSTRKGRLILQPGERGGRNGKEVWRDIRGWTLPAHASSLRLVDEASPQKAPQPAWKRGHIATCRPRVHSHASGEPIS